MTAVATENRDIALLMSSAGPAHRTTNGSHGHLTSGLADNRDFSYHPAPAPVEVSVHDSGNLGLDEPGSAATGRAAAVARHRTSLLGPSHPPG